MRKSFLILSLLFIFFSIYAQDTFNSKISMVANGYTQVSLTNGARLWANRDYVAFNVPSDFDGFEMLITNAISSGEKSQDVSVKAEEDGYIYVISRPTNHVLSEMRMMNWGIHEGGDFQYRAPSGIENLRIFKKKVSQGDKVYIPIVGDFSGITILAKEIDYKKLPIKVSKTKISIEANNLKKTTFEENVKLWLNRDYVAINTPEEFRGYDLITQAATPKGQSSVPLIFKSNSNGKAYLAARSTNYVKSVMDKEKWKLVEGSEFNYASPSGFEFMCIFEKRIEKNKEINLPVVNDFGGVLLLASTIDYSKPKFTISETMLKIDAHGYIKKTFADDVTMWIDREYQVKNIPDEFNEFDLLIRKTIPKGQKSPTESFIPSSNGSAYLIARPSSHVKEVMRAEGWNLIDDFSFYYQTATEKGELRIFSKNVREGSEVSLPSVGDFGGVSLLSKKIDYIASPVRAFDTPITLTSDKNSYKKGKLVEGAKLWNNQDYVLKYVPITFKDYEMLTAKSVAEGDKSSDELIVLDEAGTVYIVVKPTTDVMKILNIEKWEIVEDADIYYQSTEGEEKLAVYSKKAKKGAKVYIPIVKDFAGVTPIAKIINYIVKD